MNLKYELRKLATQDISVEPPSAEAKVNTDYLRFGNVKLNDRLSRVGYQEASQVSNYSFWL
jgi:hypothetical protein